MQFCLLGPLRFHDGQQTVRVGGPKQRTVLSLLLVRLNTTVSVDEIVDELWGAQAPKSAPHNVRLYIANLRRVVDRLRGASLINRHGSGYQLVVDPEHTDIEQFRRCVATGRKAATEDRWDAALPLFEKAVALWRGKALADVPVAGTLSMWCSAAESEWFGANEDLIEALLMAGFPSQAASRACGLLAVDPLRERAHALLMRARYQAGEVASALRAFDLARQYMVEQLGVEPSEELRRLRSAILARDPRLRMALTIDGRYPVSAPTGVAC